MEDSEKGNETPSTFTFRKATRRAQNTRTRVKVDDEPKSDSSSKLKVNFNLVFILSVLA